MKKDRQTAVSGELALIAAVRSRAGAARGDVRVGIGDDCAVLRAGAKEDIVVTTDFSLEGRHFRRDWHPARSAGWRCVSRGLSDLAAMGATPAAAFLSLAVLRGQVGSKFLQGFLDGVFAAAESAGVQLAGGDTAESQDGLYLADIVLVGRVPAGQSLLRSGAHAGDALYCTGALGGAAAELQHLAARPQKYRRAVAVGDHPHLYPKARLAAGKALRAKKLATACMDLSDGLSTDLAHLCEASGVGAVVEASRVPLHPLAAELGEAEALRLALDGGEDYELLFTARPGTKMPRSIGGVKVTRIGTIVARKKRQAQVMLADRDGHTRPLARGGWEHLR